MGLSAGTRLGPYEVLAPLGAGGMGKVWRARDTRLGRDVAVKVLPDEVAGDPRALARFQSEARSVAALSHPNILALFDVGESNGVHYAVTELLQGETLRTALAGGPLAVRRALAIAGQIASALSAAHENGFLHRDVKPENICLAPDGHVKLLDFGLARHARPRGAAEDVRSPTETDPSLPGRGSGTVAYMSPEQARGEAIDFRSDQFSLGIVLHEMLSGKNPFLKGTPPETMAAILRDEPEPLERAAPNASSPVRWCIDRCLAKEPAGRYDSTGDLAKDLEACRVHLSEAASTGLPGRFEAARPASRISLLTRIVAALGLAALAFGSGLVFERLHPRRHRAGGPWPTFQRLTTFDGVESWPSISPDGKTIAYHKRVGSKRDIFVLRVGGQNPTNLTAALEGSCGEPAFSPDGRLIAFRRVGGGGGIFLMGATGESVKRLTDFGHTPSWFPDGERLAIATEMLIDPRLGLTESQLWTVDIASGERRRLPVLPGSYQPAVSPHGTRIAYFATSPGGGQKSIFTIGTDAEGAGSATRVTDGESLAWSPFWSGDGRFLYFGSSRGGTMNLWRVGIDEMSGTVHGDPEPVTVPVAWAGPFRATPDGNRVVFTSIEGESILERVPFDPVSERVSGAPVLLSRGGHEPIEPRVSPLGDLLTFVARGIRDDIVVLKVDGTGMRRLTDDDHQKRAPNFSPDGEKILFSSKRPEDGALDAWVINVDGSGLTPVTRSRPGSDVDIPIWSPDGKTIGAIRSGRPILIPWPRSAGDPLPEPGPLPGEDQTFLPHSWSPDSKQLAGHIVRKDGSTGGIAVYDVERRAYRRVTDKGGLPYFLRDGRRIAFREGNVLKIVDISSGRAREILKGDPLRVIDSFGLAPDDRSFFVYFDCQQADIWLMDLGGSG